MNQIDSELRLHTLQVNISIDNTTTDLRGLFKFLCAWHFGTQNLTYIPIQSLMSRADLMTGFNDYTLIILLFPLTNRYLCIYLSSTLSCVQRLTSVLVARCNSKKRQEGRGEKGGWQVDTRKSYP
jgi:hypothetical protein